MLSSHPNITVDKKGPPIITFSSATLAGGKQGILKPDEHGYRKCLLSVLNGFNNVGAWYPATQSNLSFFDTKLMPNTLMAKRLAKRRLKAENGHPKALPGQTEAQIKARAMTIFEENVIASICNVCIDTRNYKNEQGAPIVAILGDVAPAGPHAAMLERAFLDPNQDVCWSIRSLSKSTWDTGREERHFTEVMNWDFVNDPGLDEASKFTSLNLESAEMTGFIPDFQITVGELEELANVRQLEGLNTESAQGIDVRIVLENMKAHHSDIILNPNGWLNW